MKPTGIMRATSLLILCLAATISGIAQTAASTADGVHFEEGLSWPQVLAKAKAENKPIFVDCYATWCQPCKFMDQKVYPIPEVGDYFNERFICVKVQMDVTKQDSAQTIAWRPDAKSLTQTYKINAYPTFLFFSPEGTALHKMVGAQSAKSLIKLAEHAGNPDKQYYTPLHPYLSPKHYSL